MPRPPRELRPHESARAFFGAELRHWRNLRNYSQDELGALTLNSKDTISKVEKATRWPTEQLAQRCDLVLDTGGELKRLLQLVLAERRASTRADADGVVVRSPRGHLPPLDAAAVKRPDVQDFVIESVLAAADVAQPAPVVIGGPGGFGKSVLALQVCRDERVAACFDVVLWVETGQDCTPARVVQLVANLCEQLQAVRPSITSPDQAGFHLAEALAERRVLLVVDNVWAAADLAPLLLGGPNCVRLVTTRNLGTCRPSPQVLQIPPMSVEQVCELLDNNNPVPLARPRAKQLASLCGGWPLLASVVGASVAQDVAAGASETAAIERASAAVREDGPHALDVWDADQREGTIERAVASSLRSLDRQVTISGGEELGDRYLELAAFPAAVPIPLPVLARWWQRGHGWTLTGVRQLARVLAERSLLGSYRADEDTVVLHDVFRSCLLHLARRPAVDVHKSLVDSFRAEAPDGWPHLGIDHEYVWRHLTHHLDQAGYPEEVVQVLADPDFVVTKLRNFGHEPLVDDALALASATTRVDALPDVAVARVLVDAAYLAADVTSRDDISGTLLASLGLAGQLESAAAAGMRKWEGDAFDVTWASPAARGGDGHTGAVAAVAVGGGRIVSAGEDGSVRVWDRTSHRLLRVLRGHHGWVYAAAVSTAGDLIASAGDDAVIRLWDAASGRLRGVLAGHDKRVRSLAFDRAGTRLVSGGEDGGILVWSTEPGIRLRDMSTDGCPMWSVAVGHDDSLVAAGGEDEGVRIYSLSTGLLVAERVAHRDWIRAVVFASGSPLLVTGSGDDSVCLWNVADGHLALLRSTHTGSRVRALTVSPDGGVIRAAGEDAVVRSITAEGITQDVPMPPGVDWVRAVADGGSDEAVLGCEDGAVRLLRDGLVSEIAPGRDTVWSTAFTPDSRLTLLGRSDGVIEVNTAASNSAERRLDGGGGGRVWALDAAADYVAAACGNGSVRVWSLSDWSWSAVLAEDEPRTWAVAVDPAGRSIAASSGSGTVSMWDLPTGRLRWRRAAHPGRVRTIAFDGSGRCLVTGGGDGYARSWDPATGEQLSEFRGSAGWIRTVGVDEAGARIAVGLGSGDISVHEVEGGGPPLHLFGHGGRVLAAAFVADDELVTAAADGTVRLWSLDAQRQLAQVRIDASIQCASVDRRTGSVLAASSAGVVSLRLRRGSRET